MSNQYFLDVFNAYVKRLRLIVPVVARVHGEHHPEFYDVKRLFIEMDEIVTNAVEGEFDLTHHFFQLRKASENYYIPKDVCETYEAVYVMLRKLDIAYGKDK